VYFNIRNTLPKSGTFLLGHSVYIYTWRPPGRRKRCRPNLTWAEGIKGLMGEKGLMEEDWNDRSNWRKKDNIIVKWVQEYVVSVMLISVLNIKLTCE
jgi:hypothetical protein